MYILKKSFLLNQIDIYQEVCNTYKLVIATPCLGLNFGDPKKALHNQVYGGGSGHTCPSSDDETYSTLVQHSSLDYVAAFNDQAI